MAWVVPLVTAGISLYMGYKSSKAAKSAAGVQTSAARQAGYRTLAATDYSLEALNKSWTGGNTAMQPYLDTGKAALRSLYETADSGGGAAPTFEAPTAETFTTDPGYQFRLREGQRALENNASSRGSLHSINTLQGIGEYSQNYASNEFGNVYNRSLSSYGANLQAYMANQDAKQRRFANLYNVANMGYASANSYADRAMQRASLYSQIQTTGASQYGNWLTDGANANAAGIIGVANAQNAGLAQAMSSVNESAAMYQNRNRR